jgi:cell shape-determining protein MreD
MSRREIRGWSEKPDTGEFEKKRDRGILSIFETILLCSTRNGVDAAVTIARFVSSLGVSEQTYLLFFLLLGTNNAYVVEALVGDRNPFLLFSTIKPNWYMLHVCFTLFYRHRRDELNDKCLLALLGVIQNTYKTSRFGYNVYRLTITDLYNVAKYLDKNKEQSDVVNRLILDILLDIYQIGINARSEEKKQIALKANGIRMAFFDDTKRMTDAIPEVLLTSNTRRIRTIKPSVEG